MVAMVHALLLISQQVQDARNKMMSSVHPAQSRQTWMYTHVLAFHLAARATVGLSLLLLVEALYSSYSFSLIAL
jgi:hypothetical protein